MDRPDSTSGSRKAGRRMQKIDGVKLQMLTQLYRMMDDVSNGRGR